MKYNTNIDARARRWDRLVGVAMGRQNTATFVLFLLYCLKAEACVPYFEAPENQTVAEGMSQTFRFSVNFNRTVTDRSCLNNISAILISIWNINDTGSDVFTPCAIILDPQVTSSTCNRTCSRTDRGLDCNVTMVFYRNTTRWKLHRVLGDSTPDKTFTVNVTYATDLTQFIESVKAVSTQTVLLQCDWATGNPRRTVTIYNSHRQVMNSSISGHNEKFGRLTYRMEPVNCHSYGVYTCEVEGQLETRNVTVLDRSVTFPGPEKTTLDSATPFPWAAVVGVCVALIVITSILSFIIGRQTGIKKDVCGQSSAQLSKVTCDLQLDPDGYLIPCFVATRVPASQETDDKATSRQRSVCTAADANGTEGNPAAVYEVVYNEAKQGGAGQYDVLQMSEVGLASQYDSIKH